MSIKVALVDDHRMLREALRSLLASESEIEIVGEASDGRGALALADELALDVFVLDIGMPGLNGIEVARQLRRRDPPVKILALSAHTDRQFVLEMLKAGASGYVSKGAASAELIGAIKTVASGGSYFGSEAAGAVLNRLQDEEPKSAPPASVLGSRERQVLSMLANGKRSPDIARQLRIAISTVEVHRRNIMRKLGIHSVAELTKYAVREGLASL
jgi:DNA-binding NarL/FixJ family response regulator